jgi:hypothetical protein
MPTHVPRYHLHPHQRNNEMGAADEQQFRACMQAQVFYQLYPLIILSYWVWRWYPEARILSNIRLSGQA